MSKTALITGATSGIGLSCAKQFAKKGYNLVLISRNEKNLLLLKKELCSKYGQIDINILSCDISNYNNLNKYLDKKKLLSKIDILINNAGISLESDKIEETEIEDIYKMINTNILGSINLIKILMPHMIKKELCDIINISSIAGSFPLPNESIYSSTKAFINMFSKSLNTDYSSSNVRICNISPGVVQTNFANTRHKGDREKVFDAYKGYIPLEGQDISNIIDFILETPRHVNISELIVMPTEQRNLFN